MVLACAEEPASWTELVLGLSALVLSGDLLGRFLSSMRALAPTVFAAGLAVTVHAPATR